VSAPTVIPARARVTLLFASTLTVLAGAIVAPALPSIRAAFLGDPGVETLARLVLTVPALAMAVCSPFAGVLADRLGRVPLLLGSLLLYTAAGTSGLYLDTLPAILVGRAGLGLGGAGVMTAATALIADLFTGPERGRFLSLQAAAMGGGGLVFLVSGGVLADISWRAPFAIYGVALLLVPLALALPRRAADDGDARAAPDAPVPWTKIGGVYALAFVTSNLFYVLPVQLPFLLQDEMGVTGALLGLAVAAMTLSSAPTALLYPRVAQRVGPLGAFALLFTLVAPGYLLIAWAPAYAVAFFGALVAGTGFGLFMPNANTWVAQLAPPAARGRVIGGLNFSFFLGMFLSPISTKPIVDAGGLGGPMGVFGVTGVLSLAFGVTLWVARARAARQASLAR
jgi:MFS family permease